MLAEFTTLELSIPKHFGGKGFQWLSDVYSVPGLAIGKIAFISIGICNVSEGSTITEKTDPSPCVTWTSFDIRECRTDHELRPNCEDAGRFMVVSFRHA
jgi:hypothetical protein